MRTVPSRLRVIMAAVKVSKAAINSALFIKKRSLPLRCEQFLSNQRSHNSNRNMLQPLQCPAWQLNTAKRYKGKNSRNEGYNSRSDNNEYDVPSYFHLSITNPMVEARTVATITPKLPDEIMLMPTIMKIALIATTTSFMI